MKENMNNKIFNSNVNHFKEKLQENEFMRPYHDEPEIFHIGSPKFKEFLIHCITNFHSDFHYLSFLNADSVDQELIKVLEILQILPNTVHTDKKFSNFFSNWNENDIHKFWVKFFTLSEILLNDHYGTHHSFTLESKIEFLHDMDRTQQYLNYDFPVLNPNKLKKINLNDELKKWDAITAKVNDKSCLKMENSCNNSIIKECKEESLFKMNTQKLISDLNHVVKMFDQLKNVKQDSKPINVELFNNLIDLTTDVLDYSNNFHLVEASSLREVIEEYLLIRRKNESSHNMYFLKTCDNLISVLKSKINLLL